MQHMPESATSRMLLVSIIDLLWHERSHSVHDLNKRGGTMSKYVHTMLIQLTMVIAHRSFSIGTYCTWGRLYYRRRSCLFWRHVQIERSKHQHCRMCLHSEHDAACDCLKLYWHRHCMRLAWRNLSIWIKRHIRVHRSERKTIHQLTSIRVLR